MLRGTLIDDLIHTVERAELRIEHTPALVSEDVQVPFLVYEQQPVSAVLAGVA